jgi:hypothetical protein
MVNTNPSSSSMNTQFVVENPYDNAKNLFKLFDIPKILIPLSLNDIPLAFLGPFTPKRP